VIEVLIEPALDVLAHRAVVLDHQNLQRVELPV
jgi:hypothetical protein